MLVDFPEVTVSLRARRVFRPTVINIYIILSLITLSSLGAFSIEVNEGGDRLAHSSTILLSTIAFLYVIESSLPKLSYMTITDYFVFFGSIFVLGITIEVAVLSYLISHSGVAVDTAIDNAILLVNVFIWLVYILGFAGVICFKTIPKGRAVYLPPGMDIEHVKDVTVDSTDLDFSMNSMVVFKETSEIYSSTETYYHCYNKAYCDSKHHDIWEADYGHSIEKFDIFVEVKEKDRNDMEIAETDEPEYTYKIKLRKLTGDPNIPAGFLSIVSRPRPAIKDKVSGALRFPLSGDRGAKLQVRYNPADPDGFVWEENWELRLDEAGNKWIATDGCWRMEYTKVSNEIAADYYRYKLKED